MNATQSQRACCGGALHNRPKLYRPKLLAIQADKAQPRIIVAEDDRDMRDLLAWSLRKRGHEVLECASGAALVDMVDAEAEDRPPFDLIISDVRMPDLTGLEALTRIRSKDPSIPVIVITAFPEVETRVAASELGVAALFTKPFEISDFCRLVDWILSSRSTQRGRQSPQNYRPSAGQNKQ